jgi:ParB family chromosome partitioning protein
MRADLDVWEEAYALRTLIDEFKLSQEEVGQKIGLSQSAVANKLRLLKLPNDIIDVLRREGLSERHARALLRLPSEAIQQKALAHIIRGHLTVAKTEEYIERLCRQPQRPKQAIPIYRTRDVRLFLNTLHRSLGIMRSAGLNARFDQQELQDELILTVHISK